MKKFIYTGPSWAELSYDNIPDWDVNNTNLAKEWGMPYIDYAARGHSNSSRASLIQNDKNNYPIIWIMCEPLVGHLHDPTSPLSKSLQTEYLITSNHSAVRQTINLMQLDAMNRLNRPIGIVGAHSDIIESDIKYFKNLTIIESSWQNFLADIAGIARQPYNFGYEISHRMIHGNQNLIPSNKLIDDVYNGLEFWKKLEKHGLFYDVHPNRTATELFARHVKNKVVKFINENL